MSTHLKPLKEQVLVVTGASSGIGLATASIAAARGAKVVLAARSEQTLREVSDVLIGAGTQARYVRADVANRDDLEHVADAALESFGRIDTWINNAAVGIYGKLQELKEDDARRLFDVNFWGAVNGSMIALRHLRESGGAIINVGSEVSDAVAPLQGMYSAAKHALKGFTDTLRIEVAADGLPVAVTLVQPTAVDTPWAQHAKNYLSREPKLPSPMIAPERVADTILRAAEHETRDARVGAMSFVSTTLARYWPALSDKFAEQLLHRQTRDEPPRDPQGTLYKAGESGHIRSVDSREQSRDRAH